MELRAYLRATVRRWLGVDDNQKALESLAELFDSSLKSQAKVTAAVKQMSAHLQAKHEAESERAS